MLLNNMHVLTLLISLVIVQPLLEYWIHRVVHVLDLEFHIDHHRHYSRVAYWRYRGNSCVWVISIVLGLIGWYTAALMVLRYEIVHIAAHRVPSLRPLHRHHFAHHRNHNVNFGVSAIWPDRLFRTIEP